jgi:ABC-2 type transport system permease protein
MFSKTIFKQTLKQNWKLWAIFTALTAVMGAVIIAVFDPRMIQRMMDMFADMPGMGERVGEMMGSFSLLSMMGETFYGLQGVILPLVFVIMTANSLIASQVDRGSMAYTLSTPIKRVKVVSTQALYMVTSVFCMFLVVTLVGLGTVQLRHNGLWGTPYTPDVRAAAQTLNLGRSEVADNLQLIMDSPEAVTAGAEARRIDEDVYTAYLTLMMTDPASVDNHNEINTEQQKAVQEAMMAGFEAAAEELGMEAGDLATRMGRIKNSPAALHAMSEASGFPEAMILGMINQQLASDEMEFDKGIDFSVADYINLNLGIFLLMFAVAAISFLFSCVFNLTKNSLALGAGIPIAFLILEIMSQASSDLENLKYFSLNTLFDPSSITGGGTFIPQFIALAAVGTVLYLIGIKVFKEKDLPL